MTDNEQRNYKPGDAILGTTRVRCPECDAMVRVEVRFEAVSASPEPGCYLVAEPDDVFIHAHLLDPEIGCPVEPDQFDLGELFARAEANAEVVR